MVGLTLKTLSQAWFLLGLVGDTYHLVVQVWLRGLVVGLLALVLRVMHRSLRLVDELRIATQLVASRAYCLVLLPALLVHAILRTGRLLRCPPRDSSGSVVFHQLIWLDIVDQSSLLFHLQLLKLDLFLELHGFLLLRAEVVSAVQHLAVAVGVVDVLVANDRSSVHDVAV